MREFLIVIFCLSFINTLQADELRRIPIRYDEVIVLIHKRSNELYILKGQADPLLFSSKAHLVARKVSSLPELRRLLKAQSDAGPRIPENVNRFGRTKEIKVETPPNTVRCQFEVFGEKFVWIPGGAETGWLELPKSLNSQIAHLPKLNVFPPISESDFVDVDTYILSLIHI